MADGFTQIEQLTADTVRLLAADMIEKAKSGHPGLPLGAAPAAYTLWAHELKANPADPHWPDRDRFVLSAGHGSALLYALLHLFGYGLSLDDLRKFRQLDSLTPGHPEYGHTVGVEVTTGPLGQGIANAVGMAWAENALAARFNKPDCRLVDHFTYALCGDGCLMEGISAEAASLAGTLQLGKLIVLYDSNGITIEGSTEIAFRENVRQRFEAYGWQTLLVPDGNDMTAVREAIQQAKAETDKPALIEIKTVIGRGAPHKQGTNSAHGEPLGAEELKLTKEYYHFDPEQSFAVPDEVKTYMQTIIQKAREQEEEWNSLLAAYAAKYPEDYAAWRQWHSSELPVDLLRDEDYWRCEGEAATRVSSETILNRLAARIPSLIGGAADLSPSTRTLMKGRGDYSAENPAGGNLHFGIREHAMQAVCNGMALHGGLRPYDAGFMVFADYMKPAMRLSALMKLPVVSVLTHDSIGVGEDGPTHQPVEQLAMLRSIPGYAVFRPCDTGETAAAWYLSLTRQGPSALCLSRQSLPPLCADGRAALRGGYALEAAADPDILLLASGSEVQLIAAAARELRARGHRPQVVSMLSMEIFREQPEDYKEQILPKRVRARLAVEAASPVCWYEFVGLDGDVLGMEGFGASAPAGKLFERFGFTAERVTERALAVLDRLV